MDLKLDCKFLDSSVTMGSNGELPPLIVQVGNEQTAHKMVANSVAQSGAQMIFLALRPGGWANLCNTIWYQFMSCVCICSTNTHTAHKLVPNSVAQNGAK